MREILFRGKRMDNGEWVEGNIFIPDKVAKREPPTEILIGTNVVRISYEIIPETVGQYTGLTDKNGKKIFEGDVVKVTDDDGEFSSCDCGCGKIIFLDGMWYVDEEVNNGLFNLNNAYYIEAIGNIHDNPELLKGE